MRLLIAGGGTGGHLYPGIAVAQELLSRPGNHRVHFAGTNRGLEARVLPPLGFPFTPVRAAGLVGTGVRGALRACGSLALGGWDALRLLRRFRPHACLGVGGYSSFPVVALARARGVITTVQEQNATPGVANRILGRIVRRIYAGEPDATGHFPAAKVRVTGNPLRRSLAEPLPYRAPEGDEPLHLLVVGGSQGSGALNRIVPPAVAELEVPVEVHHQAGKGNATEVRARYGDRGGVTVTEFIDDMLAAYRWAHLVVSRSGALTVAELASAGRPAILVPFPYAAGGHQEANARSAEKRGAAVCIPEAQLANGKPGAELADRIQRLLRRETLETMARRAAQSARRHAARDIVDDLLELNGHREGR